MERIRLYIMSVKFNYKEMEEMENMLSSFLASHNIELSVPVDIFHVADLLNFDVRGSEFKDKLEGLILVNEHVDKIDGFNSNKIIAYNCTKDIMLKKFIVGHELAHYIEEKNKNLNTKIVIAARDHEMDYSDDTEEQRKDYIAAALLIPKTDLENRYDKSDVSKSNKFYEEVASVYNVELELAKRRVLEVFYGNR